MMPFPRILDRHLWREFISPFFLGIAVFGAILLANLFLTQHRSLVLTGGSLVGVLYLVALELPRMSLLALPVGTLAATCLGLSTLMRERELVAMRMAGVTFRRIAVPAALFGLMMGSASFVAREYLVPLAAQASQRFRWRSLRAHSFNLPLITDNAAFTDRADRYFWVGHVDLNRNLLDRVLCVETYPGTTWPRRALVAESATSRGPVWTLRQVHVYSYRLDGSLRGVEATPTATLDLSEAIQDYLVATRSPWEQPVSELRKKSQALTRGGVEEGRLVALDLHMAYALPLACLLLAPLGAALTVRYSRGGQLGAALLCIAVVFLYNGTMNWLRAFGVAGVLPPVIAAWGPNIVFGLATLVSLWRIP
jgi:lipopolysaccharide export system permease protein